MNTWIGYFQIMVLNQGESEQGICDTASVLRHAIDKSRDGVLGSLHHFEQEKTIRH